MRKEGFEEIFFFKEEKKVCSLWDVWALTQRTFFVFFLHQSNNLQQRKIILDEVR